LVLSEFNEFRHSVCTFQDQIFVKRSNSREEKSDFENFHQNRPCRYFAKNTKTSNHQKKLFRTIYSYLNVLISFPHHRKLILRHLSVFDGRKHVKLILGGWLSRSRSQELTPLSKCSSFRARTYTNV
jgi:hypothetical protein